MTTFSLSQGTQNLIATALAQGPGTENSNYIAAYNAISADITAQGPNRVNAGTAYWFSQAAAVNGQAFKSTAAGTYIWAYTEGAAATQGYSVSNPDMQADFNKVAETVFTSSLMRRERALG